MTPAQIDTLLIDVLSALESRALELGRFERVNLHEPKSAPGAGVSLAVWLDYLGPAAGQSGLASTTGLLVWQARAYANMLAEPQDAIDPRLAGAVAALFGAYSADVDLSLAADQVRTIDLFGQSGRRLEAQAGYLQQDNKLFRVMTLTIPVIVNDMFDQG